MIRCPECDVEVQPHWDWCHACGWDPDGLRPAPVPPDAGGPSPSGATVVKVVVAAVVGIVLVVGVLILAVTFLGPSTPSSTFASVASAISPEPEEPEEPAGGVDATWTPYRPTDGSFSIEFPVAPTVEPLTDLAGTSFASGEQALDDHGDFGYRAQHADPAPDDELGDPTVELNTAIDAVVAEMTVTSRAPGTFAGMPSQSFEATAVEDGVTVHAQGIAMVGARRLYLLLVVAQDPSAVDADRFFTSFVPT